MIYRITFGDVTQRFDHRKFFSQDFTPFHLRKFRIEETPILLKLKERYVFLENEIGERLNVEDDLPIVPFDMVQPEMVEPRQFETDDNDYIADIVHRITFGWVTQRFEDNKFVSQDFTPCTPLFSKSLVEYEDELGHKFLYGRQGIPVVPFDMVQPNTNDYLPKGVCDMIEIKNINGDVIYTHEGNTLSCANLNGAKLSFADLTGADLTGADLTGADLTDAKLSFADLTGAKLSFANLRSADLTDAKLYSANLRGSHLNAADLTGAKLYDADLNGAKLKGANLTGAKLNNADLKGADFTGADLTGVKFYPSELKGADLSGAKFKYA